MNGINYYVECLIGAEIISYHSFFFFYVLIRSLSRADRESNLMYFLNSLYFSDIDLAVDVVHYLNFNDEDDNRCVLATFFLSLIKVSFQLAVEQNISNLDNSLYFSIFFF